MQHLASAAAGMSRNSGSRRVNLQPSNNARNNFEQGQVQEQSQAPPLALGQRVSIVLSEGGTLVIGGDSRNRNNRERSNPPGNNREGGLSSAFRAAELANQNAGNESNSQTSGERTPISRASSNASAEGDALTQTGG